MSDEQGTTVNGSSSGRTPSARPFTLEAMARPADLSGAWRRIPRLTGNAIVLVWRAAPRQLLTTVILQVVAAASLGAALLVGRDLLKDLIAIKEAGGSVAPLLPEFGLLIGATVFSGLVAAFIQHQQRLLGELVGRHAFERIFDVSTTVELQSFEDPVFHDQLQRAKTSGLSRPVDIVNTLIQVGTGLATSIGVTAVLLTLEPLLVPLVLAAGVPVLLATLVNSRAAYAFEWALTPQSRERAYLLELLTSRDSAKELRAFDATPFLRDRYEALTQERLRELRKFLRRRLRVALVGTTGGAVGTAAALGSLVALLATDRIDVATAVAAGIAMQVLTSRLTAITSGLGRLVESGMFLDDFQAFLTLGQSRQRQDPPVGARPQAAVGRFEGVRADGLSFCYPGTSRRVLEDVSMEVAPGEVVALVGENGSGKTTLVKLLMGLYRPDAGQVSWNGVDARRLDPRSVRENVTVLFQDFVQYHLTARENIRLGRVDRDPVAEEVEEAARRSGAHELIARLPSGYDSRLGRQFYGGLELSLGQWQRLALARAFFRGGDLLILDEPTASLDPRAEYELFAQMRDLAQGRSVLLISHRFSSVRAADRIYVIHGGRIVETGTHRDLMEREGHYADLFDLQSRAHLAREPLP